jgi:hypothetical protein
VYRALPVAIHQLLFKELGFEFRRGIKISREGRIALTVDWSLTRKLLEHLGGTSKSVTRLTDGDVEDELLDAKLLHRVLSLFGLSYRISTRQ